MRLLDNTIVIAKFSGREPKFLHVELFAYVSATS